MNIFQSSELFGAFLLFVLIFIVVLFFESFYRQYISYDVNKQHSLRFHLKKILAQILLKLGKRKKTPDHVVDQLQIFSDEDKMVNFVESREKKSLTK